MQMVPGSEGSAGSGVSGSSSGGCSVSAGYPLLLSCRSTRAMRSWSSSKEASLSCWSESTADRRVATRSHTFPSIPSSVYPFSTRTLLLSQSSYFWPLGTAPRSAPSKYHTGLPYRPLRDERPSGQRIRNMAPHHHGDGQGNVRLRGPQRVALRVPHVKVVLG
jgi:hypothetical protein